VVLVLSDFYDAEDETRRELRRVARRGHDAAMLQIMSPEETAFPYRGDLEFEDAESAERRLLDARAVEATYRSAFGEFLARCRTSAHRDGVDYALMPTDAAPERALRDYLLRRGARHHERHGARWGAR
jgi:dienelactone hydrolase